MRKKEKKREKKSFETYFGLTFPNFHLILVLLVGRGVTTQVPSSMLPQVAPTTLTTKRNSRIQHQKKYVAFNIKQQESRVLLRLNYKEGMNMYCM
jgi:hypothetical protein